MIQEITEQFVVLESTIPKQWTEIIVAKLIEKVANTGTFWSQSPENEKSRPMDDSENTDNKKINGGVDGARTRDLQRDRLAF